ncbi:MAG: flagellar hook-basal body complex protein FliE [Treponema sp.]|jgi:flagellar hook-basal body complex protein FliE|nr:flagellar hook-basal body complex protein FliE [Treponema sp.]
MTIFSNSAFTNTAARDFEPKLKLTRPDHMLPVDSPYFGSGNKVIALEKKIDAGHVTRAGTFEHTMLQALDKVSGSQIKASDLAQKAMLDPDSVEVHDLVEAQAEANMALGIARNVLSRMVQGWRDLINTR